MNELSTTVLTIVLAAFVGGVSAIIVENIKLKYRLRSEHEYKILMKLWGKAYLLKSRANNLRPIHDKYDPDESEEQRKQRRLNLFTDAMDEHMEEMYLNKPFYPKNIHDILNKLRVEAHMEAFGYGQESPNSLKYFDNAVENTKKINDFVNQLCDEIRSHLHT